jgi:hypothetical protein
MLGSDNLMDHVDQFVVQMKVVMGTLIQSVGNEELKSKQKEKNSIKTGLLEIEAKISEDSGQVQYWKAKAYTGKLNFQNAEQSRKYFEIQMNEIRSQINNLREKERYIQGLISSQVNVSSSSSSSSYNRGPWWTLWSSRYSSSSSSSSTTYDHSAHHTELNRIRESISQLEDFYSKLTSKVGQPISRDDIEKAEGQAGQYQKELEFAEQRRKKNIEEFDKICRELELLYKKLGTRDAEILMKIESVGQQFMSATSDIVANMESSVAWTQFKLAGAVEPTIVMIIPMILRGIEYGDVSNLLAAKEVSFITLPVYNQIEKIQKQATDGMTNAVLIGERPCIVDSPIGPPPSLKLF